jgi:plasmid maintenance system antidote protein VapI
MNWQEQRKMSASQLERIIEMMGITQSAAGRFLGVSERTIRRFLAGSSAVPASVALLLRCMVAHHEQPTVIPKPRR